MWRFRQGKLHARFKCGDRLACRARNFVKLRKSRCEDLVSARTPPPHICDGAPGGSSHAPPPARCGAAPRSDGRRVATAGDADRGGSAYSSTFFNTAAIDKFRILSSRSSWPHTPRSPRQLRTRRCPRRCCRRCGACKLGSARTSSAARSRLKGWRAARIRGASLVSPYDAAVAARCCER